MSWIGISLDYCVAASVCAPSGAVIGVLVGWLVMLSVVPRGLLYLCTELFLGGFVNRRTDEMMKLGAGNASETDSGYVEFGIVFR